jgi:hypothetical protein
MQTDFKFFEFVVSKLKLTIYLGANKRIKLIFLYVYI